MKIHTNNKSGTAEVVIHLVHKEKGIAYACIVKSEEQDEYVYKGNAIHYKN